jgi:hypothetical protein
MELEFFDASRSCRSTSTVTIEWLVVGDPSGTVKIWRWYPGDIFWMIIFTGGPGAGVGTSMTITDQPGNVTVWYHITAENSAGDPLDLPAELVWVEVPPKIC